nr:MAG TPA: Histone acetyltransferase subunit NuA4 [Caudoviricetes sp.]
MTPTAQSFRIFSLSSCHLTAFFIPKGAENESQ